MISPLLTLAFFITALAYSMVGFGGGSTYNALLVLADVDYRLIPSIALICNILVVSGGVYWFWREGHFNIREILPFIALSVPMAWLGGRLPISQQSFLGLLGFTLLLTGVQMLVGPSRADSDHRHRLVNSWLVGLPSGAAIGLLSGIVGIGGGIFLSPLLHLTRWAGAYKIAAASSAFILLNSIAGLSGQLMKQAASEPSRQWAGEQLINAWPLFLVVVAGGQIGSRLGSKHLPERWVKALTAALVLYVAARLLLKWYEMTFGL
ncbi:MAG: sulfite exporter TauE/SafE family protein [Xanthomonadales bacterium]